MKTPVVILKLTLCTKFKVNSNIISLYKLNSTKMDTPNVLAINRKSYVEKCIDHTKVPVAQKSRSEQTFLTSLRLHVVVYLCPDWHSTCIDHR